MSLLREVTAVHERATGAPRLEIECVVGVTHFELHFGRKKLLRGLTRGSLGEEGKRCLARRCRVLVPLPVADRLGDARLQELRPHLPEQTVRWIDLCAVEA